MLPEGGSIALGLVVSGHRAVVLDQGDDAACDRGALVVLEEVACFRQSHVGLSLCAGDAADQFVLDLASAEASRVTTQELFQLQQSGKIRRLGEGWEIVTP